MRPSLSYAFWNHFCTLMKDILTSFSKKDYVSRIFVHPSTWLDDNNNNYYYYKQKYACLQVYA